MLRVIFWPVLAPSLLFAVGVGATVPVLILAALDLGADGALASAVVSLMGAASLLCTVPAGALIDRIGDRRAMVFGTGAAVVVTSLIVLALSGAVGHPGALILYVLGLMLLAPVQDIWGLARQAVLAERLPAHQVGRAMTALGGTQRLGTVLGPLVTAALLLRLPLWSVFAFSAACAVLAVILLCIPALNRGFEGPPQGTTTSPAPVLDAAPRPRLRELDVRWKAVWLTGVAITTLSIARVVQPMMVQLWGVHLGLHESTISLLVAVGAVVELVLMVPGAVIKDRMGRASVLVLCLAIFGVGFLLMAVRPELIWMVAAVVVMGIGNGLGAGVNMTIGADLSPRRGRARFLGLWAVFNNSGKLGGPALVSGAITAAGLPAAVVGAGVLTLAGAAWMALTGRAAGLPRAVGRE